MLRGSSEETALVEFCLYTAMAKECDVAMCMCVGVTQLSVAVPTSQPALPSTSSSSSAAAAASLPPLSLFHVTSTPPQHVFFVHHPDQHDWVLGVMERLELQAASFGARFTPLRCSCLSQIAATHRNISLFQARLSTHRPFRLSVYSLARCIVTCVIRGQVTGKI